MKKNRYICAAALFTAFSVLVNSQVYGGSDGYNDNNYKSYGNLTENSDIPSLFKNDDIFTNYKNYPPVISDGVEYVPLELFYGLSNVKINYSDDNTNFYIQNKQTNEYISFNISDNYAVTGQNKVYETNVPTFYGVHYVPLRTVCDTVSIGCSTYNDGENKVYAIEIYTGEKTLSAQELLQIHAPELYQSGEPEQPEASVEPENAEKPSEPEKPATVPQKPADTQKPSESKTPEPVKTPDQSERPKPAESQKPSTESEKPYITPNTEGHIPIDAVPDDNPSEAPKPSSQVPTPAKPQNPQTPAPAVTEKNPEVPALPADGNKDEDKEDDETVREEPKAPEYKSGSVMFFFTPENFANAEKTLDAFDILKIKAVFFVTRENILEFPDIVRRIYTSGHTVGIALDGSVENMLDGEKIKEEILAAEDALYEVAKIKTRILYYDDTGMSDEKSDEIRTRIRELGLCAVKLNGDAKTQELSAGKAAEWMRNELRDIRRNFGNDTAYIRMQHTDSAISATGAAVAVSVAHPSVKIDVFDETDIQR